LQPLAAGASGWIEAALFVVTVSVLNLSYVWAQAAGAHAVAFIVCAMLVASLALIFASGGWGSEAVRIMLAPLSWLIGAGIIGMEAFYYLTLVYVTPAEASVLTRMSIPVSMVMGWALLGRRTGRVGLLGAGIVIIGVGWLASGIEPARAVPGLALTFTCAVVMNLRTFATEFHHWNRKAQTVFDKMRVTGLVLLVTSVSGTLLVAVLIGLAGAGHLARGSWLPTAADFLHPPTLLSALIVGAVVLTAMQYLAFSAVVKIGTENFIATTAFTPIATLIAQELAAAAGLLPPMPVEWQIAPAIAAVIVGVLVVLWAGRRATVMSWQQAAE
jgi:drug/metabolite transporter (DMT)-like permease